MTDSLTSKERFIHMPKLMDWTGIEGAPFEVARVAHEQVEVRECDLNVEGARALRDWLNSVLPVEPPVAQSENDGGVQPGTVTPNRHGNVQASNGNSTALHASIIELERYKQALYRANGRLMQLDQEPVKLEYGAPPPPSVWRSCADDPPPEWTVVLAYRPGLNTTYYLAERFLHSSGQYLWTMNGLSGHGVEPPSHWMQLPDAPGLVPTKGGAL